MRILLVFLLAMTSSLSSLGKDQPKIYDSVVVYAIHPDYEAPVQVDRSSLPEQCDKKITLGLGMAYRFSRLTSMWQSQISSAPSGKLPAPHVLVVATTDSGERFEVAVDLRSSATELGGKLMPDGSLRRDVVSYIRGIVGDL
jgi:hypothetical protein